MIKTKEKKMEIKKQSQGWYYITKDDITYDVCVREDYLREWEIKQIVKGDDWEDLEWINTVRTLKDAKLLIKNDFDFNKAFGGY
jgi:hypothetical protein